MKEKEFKSEIKEHKEWKHEIKELMRETKVHKPEKIEVEVKDLFSEGNKGSQ